MKTYAALTEDERADIIRQFRAYFPTMTLDPLHAAMIAADSAFKLTDRQRNGRAGSEAFAAAITVLIFRKVLTVQPTQ